MRSKAIVKLLNSVKKQELYPNEVIIVDGSTNEETKLALKKKEYKNLSYFKVRDEGRGLTRQRNFGISKVSNDIEIVCFLDDDIILTPSYFKSLIGTYKLHPNAGGVGGYIINEISWKKQNPDKKVRYSQYESEGWVREIGSRNVIRKRLGLLSNKPPCIKPEFSNGLSIGFFPPIEKIYKVDHFMGGVSSFTKEVVDKIKFSTYFEGYGLYEDSDYCLRVSKKYDLYVNTAAKLFHFHEPSGRPNKFKYGKMVVRNGWYVWRVQFPKPSIKARVKWNLIIMLLLILRFGNIFTTRKKKEAFIEGLGRLVGWFLLIIDKPKIVR